ncbi:MAG: HupE/UreJ family protein [Myxococcales bacterium]|nr:HupE/UreJ family protein [Myxococcales bacterium]
MIESALRLGLTLGLAHASDADHVCTIAALLRSERGVRDALRTSLVWGLGHSATFLAGGALVVAADVRLPGWLAPAAELLVALSLVWLGVRQWRHAACAVSEAPHEHRGLRTFSLGLVHGLAGSAGLGLVALTTMSGRAEALLFLGLYGVSVVLGMALVTLALSLPLGAVAQRSLAWRTAVLRVAAFASFSAGLWFLARLVVSPT